MPEDRLPLFDADDDDRDSDPLDDDDFAADAADDAWGQSATGSDTYSGGPAWLLDFEDMANRELNDGSSCAQVHPHVANWYDRAHESGPLESRDSILQAMACLSTEIMNSAPDDIMDALLNGIDEDAVAGWIEYVLFIGRAFERALDKGEFDDL